jgi:hypothetical protein
MNETVPDDGDREVSRPLDTNSILPQLITKYIHHESWELHTLYYISGHVMV